MFGWLFGKKKVESLTKVVQKTEVSGSRNRVVQTTNIVNQRGAKAKGDIVGGNKYSTYRQEVRTATYDPMMDLLNPINPLSPLNPMNQPDPEPRSHSHSHDSGYSHSHSHSHDSSSSWHSHDSSSSSYDSGSSSYDSGSSYSSD